MRDFINYGTSIDIKILIYAVALIAIWKISRLIIKKK
jgi:hypothetical protein|tara:strand:- start:77 stop:187 length:111 start_codon:yes stop_codon:yes gene_type:complete